MKCVIPGIHIKVFGKAINSLSRIGEELWVDPVEKGLALRVVNSLRSAYACIFFSSFFFHSYHMPAIHEEGQGNIILHLRCKFPVKSILPLFRSLNTLERSVDKCSIYTSLNDGRMIFQLFCKHGLTITHNLCYEDCEPLQAVFAKNTCPNILKIQARVLSDVIVHFPSYQEEVTLTATPLKVSLKSYSEEDLGFTKSMHTEIHLSPDEFHYFQVGVDSDVTFCLKELRGFLAFAEMASSYISVHFSEPGKPIAFSMDDMVIEANCILATLAESESRTSSQRSQHIELRYYFIQNTKTQDGNGAGGQALLASKQSAQMSLVVYTLLVYQFCTMFFGAVSSKQQNTFDSTFCSLATASEDEEDDYCRELSQTF
ncbi:cell cycle checkpoint control protein RAD9B [Rhinophrynus dorsalis]